MSEGVLELLPGNDHVQRLSHRGAPLRAVVELVWNAVDAEAGNVTVEFRRGDMDAIDQVHVVDDGHGISPDELSSTFGMIGESWKRPGDRTKNGKRTLHGARGEGRLRAFALGDSVRWDSHAVDAAGVLHHVVVDGDSDHYRQFPHRAASVKDVVPTGTVVVADNHRQISLAALDAPQAHAELLAHFAPLLLDEPGLSIVYDGHRLDPAEHVTEDTSYELPVQGSVPCTLRIIEWQSAARRTPRTIHFGADGTHFPYREPATRLEAQFPFTAYVTWPALGQDEVAVLGLHEMTSGPVSELWKAVDRKTRDHFADRRRRRRREQVRQWQETGAYPYTGRPRDDAEKAERAVFDAIAGPLAPHIAPEKIKAKLTLALLKDALQHDPGTLTTILHEVVSLNPDDAAILTRLLGETTLPGIIHAANRVASRRKIIEALEHLVHDPQDSKQVGERDHLHKILERELWVFGEGYTVMRSEKGLTDLARTHLKLAGLPDDKTPVTRDDGRSGRVDLHLAVRDLQHDRIRHLVVELKAPRVTVGRKEIDQVEDYSNTILDNRAFSTPRAEWDFVLVASGYDEVARRRQEGRPDGLLWDRTGDGKPRVRAYLRSWSDLLAENRQRLDFLSRDLDLDPSLGEGLQFVKDTYPDLLPEALTEPDTKPA